MKTENKKNLDVFKEHLGQTSDFPLSIEIEKAEGMYMFSADGKKYLDLISGLSVNNLGHRHPAVVDAIKNQVDKYLHVMVYGEFILKPQTDLIRLLADNLPASLQRIYLVNSGSEAIEGAMKLAKRYSGRSEIICFEHAYHGGTQGALAMMGDEMYRQPFRPLSPDIRSIRYNEDLDLHYISNKTACVIVEAIQAEAGIRLPSPEWMIKLRHRCNETGTLLIFDEVQTGFGRTGSLFAFERSGVIPDVLVIGKALGGGMPVAAFIASNEIMNSLKTNPVLGHITTFGGHPLCCAAAYASLKVLTSSDLIAQVDRKHELFKQLLVHKEIQEIRGKGLFMAIKLKNSIRVKKFLPLIREKGLMINSFIFCNDSFRIAPPLIITDEEIRYACSIILETLDEISIR